MIQNHNLVPIFIDYGRIQRFTPIKVKNTTTRSDQKKMVRRIGSPGFVEGAFQLGKGQKTLNRSTPQNLYYGQKQEFDASKRVSSQQAYINHKIHQEEFLKNNKNSRSQVQYSLSPQLKSRLKKVEQMALPFSPFRDSRSQNETDFMDGVLARCENGTLMTGKHKFDNPYYVHRSEDPMALLGDLCVKQYSQIWSFYEGELENGLFHGFGNLKIYGHYKLSGHFKNGSADGRITCFNKRDNKIHVIGIFKDGFIEEILLHNDE